MADPDDGDVFYGDQRPTDQDKTLGAGVARLAVLHDHFLDEESLVGRRTRVPRKKLEEVREHGRDGRE